MNKADLAVYLARSIFERGDEPLDKVQRIQFRGGNWHKNMETDLGGLNEIALVSVIMEALDRLADRESEPL